MLLLEDGHDLVRKDSVCTIEQARGAWKSCRAAMGQDSPALAFILNLTELARVEREALILTVPYSFHKDKLMSQSCRPQLEEMLTNLLQRPIHMSVEVLEQPAIAAPDQELQELAAAFGGEVV